MSKGEIGVRGGNRGQESNFDRTCGADRPAVGFAEGGDAETVTELAGHGDGRSGTGKTQTRNQHLEKARKNRPLQAREAGGIPRASIRHALNCSSARCGNCRWMPPTQRGTSHTGCLKPSADAESAPAPSSEREMRGRVCRPFRALSFLNATPRAALVSRLPCAGLFAHRWCSFQIRSKVPCRL